MSIKGRTAVCIGNFDGLHRGHRKLLDEFLKKSRSLNLKPVLITFRPHPYLFLIHIKDICYLIMQKKLN